MPQSFLVYIIYLYCTSVHTERRLFNDLVKMCIISVLLENYTSDVKWKIGD